MSVETDAADSSNDANMTDDGPTALDVLVPLVENIRALVIGPLLIGLLALGVTYLITPTFTARTSFLPPQQQQTAAASALASLGSLAGLAGGAGALRTPSDQYVSLMQSVTVSDRIIDQFKLRTVYDEELLHDARRELANNLRISIGKKDGLISVEVDDEQPQRAADIANQFVEELRRLTSLLAVTEAQQRRVFFENQLQQTRDKLTTAQQELQASGFSQGALRAEPKAAAEGYARLRAELTAAEVRLQSIRGTLADNTPEVNTQQALVSALRAQLAKVEQATTAQDGPQYIDKYRNFKYHEALFELFSRQYELARLDESREGALVQVVDPASPPEKKSKPRRGLIVAVSAVTALLCLAVVFVLRFLWQQAASDPARAENLNRLRMAWRGKT